VAAQRGPQERAAAERAQLLSNVRARRLARRARRGEGGPGLKYERLDLHPWAVEDSRDLGVRDVVEYPEHERGVLVLRELRDVGEDGSKFLAFGDRVGDVVLGRPGQVENAVAIAAGTQHGQAAVAGDCKQPRPRRGRWLSAHEVAVGSQECELHDVLGLFARPEHPLREREHRPAMALDEHLERPLRSSVHELGESPIRRKPQGGGGHKVCAAAHNGIDGHGETSIAGTAPVHPETSRLPTCAGRLPAERTSSSPTTAPARS
jgi:hypothetical protein